MTTLDLYRKHKNGKVSREKFLYEVRRDNNLPFITNLTSYDDAVKILKNKGIVTEVDTKEAKADEAVKAEVKAKAPSTKKPKELHIDYVNPYEYRHGLQYELNELGEYTDEALEKAKSTVLKNLAKDVNFYSTLLNQKQSHYEFKATETDAKGMQAKADGHLKKEAKKDEKANVQDSLGKKEAGKKKPKGVKVMPDKGVTGSEKTIKEGFEINQDDDQIEISDDSGDYVGFVEDGKVSFSVVYDDTTSIEDKFGEEGITKNNWKDVLGPKHAFVKIIDTISGDVEALGDYVQITVDADKLASANIKETFDDKKIKDKIESGEIKPEEVKAAAEKAMKGDSTSLIALMTGLPGISLSEDTVEGVEEEVTEGFKYFDNYEDFENTLFQLYPQVKANPEKYKKERNGEISYSDGYVNWASWNPNRPKTPSKLPPGAINLNNKMSSSDLIYPADSRMDEGLEEIKGNKYIVSKTDEDGEKYLTFNDKAVANYLKSVIDPEEIESVDTFMFDDSEGWEETVTNGVDSDAYETMSEEDVEELATSEMSYYLFSKPDEFPFKEMNEHHNDPNFPGGNKIHAMLDKVADEWGKDSDVYSDLEDAIIGWSDRNGELSPKGKIAIRALLSNWDMLDDYEQFLNDDDVDSYPGNMGDEMSAPTSMEEANPNYSPEIGSTAYNSAEDQFNQLMSKYDWYYEMSDDPRVYDRGTAMDNQLRSLGKQIGADKAVALFNDKAPSDRKVTSTFFMEGKEDKHAKLKEILKAKVKEAISSSELIQAKQKGQIIKIPKSATQDIQAAEKAKANYSTYE